MTAPEVIAVEEVKVKDLQPGDLFSADGPAFWGNLDRNAVAYKVYIRSTAPVPNAVEAEKTIYRITIQNAIEVARSIPKTDG